MFFLPRKDRWLDDYAVPAIVYFLGDHAPIETRVFPSLGTHGKGKLEVPLLIDKTRPGGEMQRSWPVNGACKKGRVENGSRYRREGLRPRSACDTREETRKSCPTAVSSTSPTIEGGEGGSCTWIYARLETDPIKWESNDRSNFLPPKWRKISIPVFDPSRIGNQDETKKWFEIVSRVCLSS